jgi:lysophospholipase L1-like esterase
MTTTGNEPATAILTRTITKIRDNKPLIVSFYGDSISDVDRSPGWYGGASCREKHYAQVFRALANERWGNPHVMIHYFGIGGQNAYEGLGRLFLLQAVKPDLVVVAFGANDLGGHPLTPVQHANALKLIFTGLRAQLDCDIVALAASSGGPDFERWAEVGPFVQAQADCSREHGVPFINTRDELLTRLARGEPWTKYYPSHHNGHPNDEGHRLWGDMLFQLLNSLK